MAKRGGIRRKALFTLDHSTIHTKLAEDELRVTQMNLRPGGQQSELMKDTMFGGKIQYMNFTAREQQPVLVVGKKVQVVNPEFRAVAGVAIGGAALPDQFKIVDTTMFKGKSVPHGSVLEGVPKGMKQILLERGLWRETFKKRCAMKIDQHSSTCCATGALLSCKDFSRESQVSDVSKLIESKQHLCLFLPKYHVSVNAHTHM